MAESSYWLKVRPSVRMCQRGCQWTDLFFVKPDTRDLYEDLSRCYILDTWLKSANSSGQFMLTSVRNILQFPGSATRTHSCISVVTLSGFILLTATCLFNNNKIEMYCCAPVANNGVANAPWYVNSLCCTCIVSKIVFLAPQGMPVLDIFCCSGPSWQAHAMLTDRVTTS